MTYLPLFVLFFHHVCGCSCLSGCLEAVSIQGKHTATQCISRGASQSYCLLMLLHRFPGFNLTVTVVDQTDPFTPVVVPALPAACSAKRRALLSSHEANTPLADGAQALVNTDCSSSTQQTRRSLLQTAASALSVSVTPVTVSAPIVPDNTVYQWGVRRAGDTLSAFQLVAHNATGSEVRTLS